MSMINGMLLLTMKGFDNNPIDCTFRNRTIPGQQLQFVYDLHTQMRIGRKRQREYT